MGSQGVVHDLGTEQQSMFVQTHGPIFEEWKINLITDLILLMAIYLFISLPLVTFRKVYCLDKYHFLLMSKCISIELFILFSNDFKDVFHSCKYNPPFILSTGFVLSFTFFSHSRQRVVCYLKVYWNASLLFFVFYLLISSLIFIFFFILLFFFRDIWVFFPQCLNWKLIYVCQIFFIKHSI